MDLPELLRIQDALGLRDTHLIAFARDSFAIAHTDDERAVFDLEDCALHVWALGVEQGAFPEGVWRLDYGGRFVRWPNLVALDILSRSPIPRPKLFHVVTGGWPSHRVESVTREYNAMVDELEILSAALVAKGMDPKRVLEAWRGERCEG